MKILQVGKFFHPIEGGIEDYYYELSKELVKRGNIVSAFVSNTGKNDSHETVDGIHVYRFGIISKIFNAPISRPYFHLIHRIDPDIIHLHCPNPLAEINILLYKLLGGKAKVIVTYHSDVIPYTITLRTLNFLRSLYLLPLLKLFSSKVIATSKNYVSKSAILQLVEDNVSVVPLFVDTDIFKPRAKRKSRKTTLFFAGRLIPYKGLEYLLAAIKRSSQRRPDIFLCIAGDGILRKELVALAKNLGISNSVKFLGKVRTKRLLDLYDKCDIFILPSIYRSEAFGLAQLQAMSFGKPVISTDIPGSGVPFVNKNGETGLVVKPRNSLALSEAIIYLLDNQNIRKTFGVNARKRATKFFSKKTIVNQILSIYKNSR